VVQQRWILIVDKTFFIKGNPKNIFGVGFRPALRSTGSELGIKVHATNVVDESQVRIIASGSSHSIDLFYNSVKNKDLRVFQKEPPKYRVTKLDDYKGVDIDWQGYNTEYISEQLSKSIIFYSQFFEHVNKKLDTIEDKVSSTNNKYNKNHKNGRKRLIMTRRNEQLFTRR
jgi:acylphosphatase